MFQRDQPNLGCTLDRSVARSASAWNTLSPENDFGKWARPPFAVPLPGVV
jgi:hypothetical protein